MKYAIKFFNGCRVLPKANEVIIKYNEKNPELLHFAQKLDEKQRLVVDITGLVNKEENLKIFEGAAQVHKNFALLTSIEDLYVPDYYEGNIQFFFIEGVDCWDELIGQLQMRVSDVYILNELGFSLDKVSEICHKEGVQVRIYPNVAQTRTKITIDKFKRFFIRPDDLDFYQDYVDVFEFFGPLDKQPVLYDIYTSERWFGPLNQVIIGLDDEIENVTIVPYFGMTRAKCGKRCAYGKCNICGTIKGLAKTLEDKNLGMKVKYERKANENNSTNESAETIQSTSSVSEE